MSRIHEVAAAVAEIILAETNTHQLLMPEVEIELTEQLTAPPDSPIFSGCTGDHVIRIRKLRETILELTIAGVGVKALARKLDISPQTVRAVRASEWARGQLDPLKQRLGREYLATADLLRAEAIERIDEIPAHVLLLSSAQAADKGQLLTGGATTRVERVLPAAADLHDLIDALPCLPVDGFEREERGSNKGVVDTLALMPGPKTEGVEVSTSDSQSARSPSGEESCVSPSASEEGAP